MCEAVNPAGERDLDVTNGLDVSHRKHSTGMRRWASRSAPQDGHRSTGCFQWTISVASSGGRLTDASRRAPPDRSTRDRFPTIFSSEWGGRSADSCRPGPLLFFCSCFSPYPVHKIAPHLLSSAISTVAHAEWDQRWRVSFALVLAFMPSPFAVMSPTPVKQQGAPSSSPGQ
jgi:hypothetical protein